MLLRLALILSAVVALFGGVHFVSGDPARAEGSTCPSGYNRVYSGGVLLGCEPSVPTAVAPEPPPVAPFDPTARSKRDLRDENAISQGVVLNPNGMAASGSYGARRAYVRLDKPNISPPFVGRWAKETGDCISGGPPEPEVLKVVTVTRDSIETPKGKWIVLDAYAAAPDWITTERLEAGEHFLLKADDATEATDLLIAGGDPAFPEKTRYFELHLKDGGQSMQLVQPGKSRGIVIRCSN